MTRRHVWQASILVLAAISLAGCGGDDSMPQPITGVPSPTPSPAPSPTPTPTPTSTGSGTQTVVSDIQYGEGATTTGSIALLLDIYQPDVTCQGNRPTVLFVHGGGFTMGNKAGGAAIRAMADAMNARDINFVSINYRLDPDNPVPSAPFQSVIDDLVSAGFGNAGNPLNDAIGAAIEDTVSALRFLESSQDAYCIDTSRLAYWGSSAGAFTVLQVAYGLDQFGIARPSPLVVVDYWGNLIRDSDLDLGEAPFFVIHGTNDQTVSYQSAVELTNQADSVAVNYAFYSVIGAGHGFDATGTFTYTVDDVTLIDITADFVKAHLGGGMPLYRSVEVRP
jgi:acetyl esterase/lipase